MHFSVKHVLKTISCVLIAAHPNKFNQGVTPEMRVEDRQLHWGYRAREQGADQLLPDWIYDN